MIFIGRKKEANISSTPENPIDNNTGGSEQYRNQKELLE